MKESNHNAALALRFNLRDKIPEGRDAQMAGVTLVKEARTEGVRTFEYSDECWEAVGEWIEGRDHNFLFETEEEDPDDVDFNKGLQKEAWWVANHAQGRVDKQMKKDPAHTAKVNKTAKKAEVVHMARMLEVWQDVLPAEMAKV